MAVALTPTCRETGRLRSDLRFKYSYEDTLSDQSLDIDFSQRSGESIRCNAAGTEVVADGVTLSIPCESVTRAEGPGMDIFGWAKQLVVGKKGSVKVFSGDLNASPVEFTSGDECGSTVRMALGGHYMAAVCKKAVRVYRFDGTWSDHKEISFPNAVDHELRVDLNHEDYMIVSEPSTNKVSIYRLGIYIDKVKSLNGNGEVATAVNCRGSVFAYASGGSTKLTQLSQKDGSWTNLAAISVDPVKMSMSSDVLAIALADKTNVYMFANSGTSYAEYKTYPDVATVVRVEHDDLAIVSDALYIFNEGPSTKCRALQKLEDGVCVDCGAGHTNAHDNTETTCNPIQCTSSQYASNNACHDCPATATGVAGPATIDSVCTCQAGALFDTGACNAILCAENEHVSANECTACPAGEANAAGDDASGADTQCEAVSCSINEFVSENICTPCPDGGQRNAGDDARGNDTACEPITTCAANEYYDSSCQSCFAGTASEVIDDSIQKLGNASCAAVLCAENERVQNNACVACPAGALSAGGDDATGADTQCTCSPNYEGDGTSCTACGANEVSSDGAPCSCGADSESDGSGCVACPANSGALPGPITSKCIKNEAAIWHDEGSAAEAGACTATLDCTTKASTSAGCIQPYEDGGVLQQTTPCCAIHEPSKCGCNENYRVVDNVCTACPTGEVRPAGDDPDNGNTYCNTEGITLAFGNNGDDDFVYDGQNDPDISLKVGQLYTFMRDSGGHPLRISSEADCPTCATGTYDTLPPAFDGLVDAVQGSANIVHTFTKAGTYYYVCTSHPAMVGKLVVSWEACNIDTYGSITLSSSCQIQSTVSLTGATTIHMGLRSTGQKLILGMGDISPAINAGAYALTINGFEISGVESDNAFVESTTGTITLNSVDIKGNTRGTGAMFKTADGHIVGQSMVIEDSGDMFEAAGGDISLADTVVSTSKTVIKQVGGAVVVRDVNITGGTLADMTDATSVFEAVFTDGGDGIKSVRSAVQVERSHFKGHTTAPIQFDSTSCTKCDRELVVESSTFEDSVAIDATTDANKPKVKVIETSFTSSGSVVSDNGMELYVIDEVDGKEMSTTETKTETCLPYQCSHKPLATSCKVVSGKGTQCICDVGVATYNMENNELDKKTTVEEMLSVLFATADTADRVVKLVDRNERYIPTQPTSAASKSNILLLKPTNVDGEFQSEKTILLRPDSGTVCATFQTWLCAELTACHYANGTITADCDGIKILTGAFNATRRFRSVLKAVHPEDPNCNGAISNLKQQCSNNGEFYTRCVQNAHFHHDQCVCMDGMLPNSAGDACLLEQNLCAVNQRVLRGRCVACEGHLTNKAGDDLTGSDTVCDDVICKENFYSDGSGKCRICAVGSFNLEGDIAYDADTSANGPATTCCPSGQYEFDVDLIAGTRVCKACDDATDSLRNRFGANGAGLHCCRGTRLDAADSLKCGRILDYYKKVCQPLEANAATCKSY